MKGVFLFLMIVVFLIMIQANENFHGVAVDDDTMKLRKQMAVEMISSDEGFLSEYMDTLSRQATLYFYVLAYDLAEDTAKNTLLMFDNDEAYVYMVAKIEGKNGVKDQVEDRVKRYILGAYIPDEIDINKYYETH